MQHLFIIDPLETLNLQFDSSLRLMFALNQIGHDIWICTPTDLSWLSGTKGSSCLARQLNFKDQPVHFLVQDSQVRDLRSFQAIHMRKDPPYDMAYITNTWILDGAGPDTKIYNAPQALRSINEKLAVLAFPNATKPGLLSTNLEQMLTFLKDQCAGDGIIKPLDLFGGRGVTRLNLNEPGGEAKVRKILAKNLAVESVRGSAEDGIESTAPNWRFLQPFDKAIFEGEVRVFSAFGEPLAWCLKRPAPGSYLANTRAGATLEHYTPTTEESQRVKEVAGALRKRGVEFVGFDVIGSFISEINLTSPRLLTPAKNHADEASYYDQMAELTAGDLSH